MRHEDSPWGSTRFSERAFNAEIAEIAEQEM
jgi:hypothetical protein